MKVFLSHAHTDAPLAARVCKALTESGLEVWDSDRDLLPGDNWAGEVARALEESEAMVVLLTPAAASSPYVKREIEYALGAKNYSNRLIPVVVGDLKGFPMLHRPCHHDELSWTLASLQMVDFQNDSTKVAAICCASGASATFPRCRSNVCARTARASLATPSSPGPHPGRRPQTGHLRPADPLLAAVTVDGRALASTDRTQSLSKRA